MGRAVPTRQRNRKENMFIEHNRTCDIKAQVEVALGASGILSEWPCETLAKLAVLAEKADKRYAARAIAINS